MGIVQLILYRLWPDNNYLGNSAGADCTASGSISEDPDLTPTPRSDNYTSDCAMDANLGDRFLSSASAERNCAPVGPEILISSTGAGVWERLLESWGTSRLQFCTE